MANELKLTYESGLDSITANVFSPAGVSREANVTMSDTGHAGLYLGSCATIRSKDEIIYFNDGMYLGGDTYSPTAVTVISTSALIEMITAVEGTAQSGVNIGHDIRMGQTEVGEAEITVLGRRRAIEQENVTSLVSVDGRIEIL